LLAKENFSCYSKNNGVSTLFPTTSKSFFSNSFETHRKAAYIAPAFNI